MAKWRPNALTQNTIAKSKRGEEVYFAKDAAELFQKLGISGGTESLTTSSFEGAGLQPRHQRRLLPVASATEGADAEPAKNPSHR